MLRRRFVFLALVSSALSASQPLPRDKVQEIEKLVTEEMSRQGIPAISVAVATSGELRWSSGFGLSDVENWVPAKASTVYRLGSISKPITAVAALQLVERGLLELDAPVQKYVAAFPQKQAPITTRLLLGHLAGIRHYNSEEEVNSTRHYTNQLDPLAIFAADPLVAEPGVRFHYTTYGYVLLGAVVEAASAVPFTEYLRERIFQPAGMDRIQADDVYSIIPNRTRGYRRYPTGQLQNCSLADTSNKIPGGGLSSTVEDLVKFAAAVRRGALLKPDTVETMFTRQSLRDGSASGYGLGWGIANLEERKMVSHTGGQQGTSTMLAMLPREGVIVAVMCNLEGGNVSSLAARIAKLLLP